MNTGRVQLGEFEVTPVKPSTYSSDMEIDKPPLVKIILMNKIDLEIDFINFPVSMVNAYRRIILAEVETMAIEKVHMYNNTSLVQDEVLAHRIGLVPLNANPKYFEYRNEDETEWSEHNSIKYELKVTCTRDRLRNIVDKTVYSSHLVWQPIGNQSEIFSKSRLDPLHDDIILAKLNPRHEIHLEAYAVKGIGSDHAKFQPGLTWYRMLPEVTLLKPIKGDLAKTLQSYFSPGVIDLETDSEGEIVAQVGNARYDSCSRNVFMNDELKDAVKMTRNTEHIIFYVESASAMESIEILEEAIEVLGRKCDNLLTELDAYIKNQ